MKKRTAGRPKKEPGEVLVDLPIKVDPETLIDVQNIADQLDRPRGWVARKLLLRGIEVYLRDVKIRMPELAIQTEEEAAQRIVQLKSPENVEELAEELADGKPFVRRTKREN